jgi:hypothetical protein
MRAKLASHAKRSGGIKLTSRSLTNPGFQKR